MLGPFEPDLVLVLVVYLFRPAKLRLKILSLTSAEEALEHVEGVCMGLMTTFMCFQPFL